MAYQAYICEGCGEPHRRRHRIWECPGCGKECCELCFRMFGMAVGREMVLSLAGNTSKYPGSVQVKVGGEWVGRIEPTGKVAGPLSNRKDVLDTLASIAVDPAAAAKAYGALTCSCSFCGKGLTDEGSVEVGYGPVCAAHWGLPHTPKGTPVVLQASFKQVAMATPAVSQMMDF